MWLRPASGEEAQPAFALLPLGPAASWVPDILVVAILGGAADGWCGADSR